MEKFVSACGIPVRIATQGDNKDKRQAVVLLHGYLESLEIWEDLSKALGAVCYTVCFDMPGHGFSGTRPEANTMEFMADVVEDLCRQLGVEKCLLVGHSMGGYASLAFAKKYPQMLAGICLLHSSPNADTEEKRVNRDREITLIQSGRKALLVTTAISNMFAQANLQRMANRIMELEVNANIADNEGVISCIRGMKEREDLNDMLAKLDKPTMLILGKADKYIAWESAEALMERLPKAKKLVLENSGHCGFFEEPEVVKNGLLEFISSVFA
ncbi:MAG: alpha/beta hydrolase [Prevotellaceae bacterium]|jgi:pimeloyl-ACP methyl ester carboxylesterase|nr:alpha/beta hydrolase [Prevotellaceae bacterium]